MTSPVVRLPVLTEDTAGGEIAQIYDLIRARFGMVPEVFQLLGTRPEYLQVLWQAYLSVFDAGVLPWEDKELIAAFVANEAGCQYCADAHSLLAQMTGASSQIAAATKARSIANGATRRGQRPLA
jgi:AhpD family alkylhydroperoxidase